MPANSHESKTETKEKVPVFFRCPIDLWKAANHAAVESTQSLTEFLIEAMCDKLGMDVPVLRPDLKKATKAHKEAKAAR